MFMGWVNSRVQIKSPVLLIGKCSAYAVLEEVYSRNEIGVTIHCVVTASWRIVAQLIGGSSNGKKEKADFFKW